MFNDIKGIFKHSSVYGFSTILQKGIGFFMIPIYTAFLTPSDYGILELMELTINIISMLAGMRLGAAIIRYYNNYDTESEKNELFSTALIFVCLVTFVLIIILQMLTENFASWILGDPKYFRYFQIIFMAMGLQIIATVPESVLLAEKKSVVYSGITIFTLVSYLTWNILFLVVIKIGITGLLLSMLITKVLNVSFLMISIRKKISISFSIEKLYKMIQFTLPLVPAALFMFIMHYSDRFFIRKFCDLNELGLYSLGYKFGMIISVIVSEPFFRIWNTIRYELAKQEDGDKKIGIFFTYYSMVVITAALGISIIIREVVLIIAPNEYSGSSAIVAAITIAYVLYGVANFFSLGMMVSYNTKSLSYIQIGVALFNIIVNYFFIKEWGIFGAAGATLLSFFILSILSFLVSQYLYEIKLEYKRILMLWGLYFILLYASSFIRCSLLPAILLKGIIFTSFPFILYFLGFFTRQEQLKVKALLMILIFNLKKSILLKEE